MPDLTLTEGDTWPPVSGPLVDEDGVIDLTIADSVLFIMTAGATVVTGDMTFVDRANGIVSYTWEAGDTDVPGTYQAITRITWNVGETEQVPNGTYKEILIRPRLD